MLPALPCRLLIVEDDPAIMANLVAYLEQQGHEVDMAYDGQAAQGRLQAQTYDAIVLDLGLPRVDGTQVLKFLRHDLGLATPVLVLTARDELTSKLDMLAAGADDYVTKPFALAEVAMRLHALHRRASSGVVSEVRQSGELRLDRRSHTVSVGQQVVHLMPRSMQILEILLRDPGRVVTRQELEALLWPGEIVASDALRSQIHILRKALVQAGYTGLATVHGVGYRLT